MIDKLNGNSGIVPPWLLTDDDDIYLPVLPIPPSPPDWDSIQTDGMDDVGESNGS